MERVIETYCKRVGRLLRCLPTTRAEILRGLKEELLELSPAYCESFNALEQHYGTVKHSARELQDSIPYEEQALCVKRRKCAMIVLISILCLIVAIAVAYAFFVEKRTPFSIGYIIH